MSYSKKKPHPGSSRPSNAAGKSSDAAVTTAGDFPAGSRLKLSPQRKVAPEVFDTWRLAVHAEIKLKDPETADIWRSGAEGPLTTSKSEMLVALKASVAMNEAIIASSSEQELGLNGAVAIGKLRAQVITAQKEIHAIESKRREVGRTTCAQILSEKYMVKDTVEYLYRAYKSDFDAIIDGEGSVADLLILLRSKCLRGKETDPAMIISFTRAV
jgi:exopolysaccharide biosynthesis protein